MILRRWRKQKVWQRGRAENGRRHWSSVTLTESIFWQASASCNNLEIISIHKGPAVWQSKRSVADRSLRFSRLPVCVCAGSTSISGLLSPRVAAAQRKRIEWGRGWSEEEDEKVNKNWEGGAGGGGWGGGLGMSNWEKPQNIQHRQGIEKLISGRLLWRKVKNYLTTKQVDTSPQTPQTESRLLCCSPMMLHLDRHTSSTGQHTGGHPHKRNTLHTGSSHQHIQLLLSIVTALTATVHLAPGN